MPPRARTELDRFENTIAAESDIASTGLSSQINQITRIADRVGEEDSVAAQRARAEKDSEIDAATFERATRGFDLSERQQRGAQKRVGLSRAVAVADRSGNTRRGFASRAIGASRSGVGLQNALFNQRFGVEGSQAANFTRNKIGDIRRASEAKAGRFALVGKIAGAALMLSSEKVKDKQGKPQGLLSKLRNVRVENWNYKGNKEKHIGPYAEEFNQAFDVGKEVPDHISIIDAVGVALGSIKELDARISANGA